MNANDRVNPQHEFYGMWESGPAIPYLVQLENKAQNSLICNSLTA